MRITVYHNVDDSSFFGWKPEHPLVPVFEYADSGNDTLILHRAWETFNIGHEPEFNVPAEQRRQALLYRARKLRSLSVGDVIAIDGQPHAVESFGWQSAGPGDLNIVEGQEADRLIRKRYRISPRRERLTLTVPLVYEEEG